MERKAPQQTKNADGKRVCRMPGCGKLPGKGRRSYCGDAHALAFEIAYFPSTTRWHVYRRDKGICFNCKCDTDKILRLLKLTQRQLGRDFAKHVADSMGFPSFYRSGSIWQADHIVECARGGWGLGLENFRTACTPCHKLETKRLAAELAAERRLKHENHSRTISAST